MTLSISLVVTISSWVVGWLYCFTKFGRRGGRASVCGGKRAFQRMSHFPWKSSMPSNGGSGLQ
jgi:hypothetical protein